MNTTSRSHEYVVLPYAEENEETGGPCSGLVFVLVSSGKTRALVLPATELADTSRTQTGDGVHHVELGAGWDRRLVITW